MVERGCSLSGSLTFCNQSYQKNLMMVKAPANLGAFFIWMISVDLLEPYMGNFNYQNLSQFNVFLLQLQKPRSCERGFHF